jgi:hypothetical protein
LKKVYIISQNVGNYGSGSDDSDLEELDEYEEDEEVNIFGIIFEKLVKECKMNNIDTPDYELSERHLRIIRKIYLNKVEYDKWINEYYRQLENIEEEMDEDEI